MKGRNEFIILRRWMVGLGIMMGMIFPPFMLILGVPYEYAMTPIVWAATIAAGSSIGIFNIILASKVVGSRINSMREVMDELSAGKDVEAIPCAENADAFGAMSKAISFFRDSAREKCHLQAQQKENESRAHAEKIQAMNDLADNFEASIKGVVSVVSDSASGLQGSAESMAGLADSTTQKAGSVESASTQATQNVQTVASAAEELSASISEISRQVSESTRISSTAVTEVDAANIKVQGLADAASKIGEVVALITDIAEQTNLLALNATIEAARAGEAGKGFAVVASEVKNLANQTARATEEISTQITGIQDATGDAVQAIGAIGGTINQINEIASAIAAAVEEQGAATTEIARNVEQAAAGTTQVSANIHDVTSAASDSGAAANDILNAARTLSDQAHTLSQDVDQFVARIRQA